MAKIRGFLGATSVAAVAAVTMSSAALADGVPSEVQPSAGDDRKFGYSITISAVSDYLFRGISLTNGDPAFQPFIEFTYGNPNLTWYLDLWGSNVKDELGDPWELDIYAGVRPVTGPISWDFGALVYTNPSVPSKGLFANPRGDNTDYVEFKAQASITPITNLTLTGIGYYTPDQGFATAETETGEFDAGYTLPAWSIFTPTVSGAVGHTHAERAASFDALCNDNGKCNLGTDDYTYWNAGLKLTVDKFFMDFRYWDTSISKHDDALGDASARFLFTAGVNLP